QGIASRVDVAEAQTQLDTTRAQYTDIEVARADFEHAIAVLAGKPPADVTIASSTRQSPIPEIPVVVPSELLERRPDIAAAERRASAANAQIGVAEAAFFPAIGLTASGGVEASRLGSL